MKRALLPLILASSMAFAAGAREVTWEDLIPPDYQPENLFAEMDVNNLEDGDPRAKEAMEKLRAMWKEAPVVKTLDTQMVKISGFAVPMDGDGEITTEFLLVPYYGACVHVPPPPSNQVIVVSLEKPQDLIKQPFDPVWVEGKMTIQRFSNELADAGYAITNAKITAFEE